jgi:HK97 family phage prohead protease
MGEMPYMTSLETGLELKFCQVEAGAEQGDDLRIEGYASLFGAPDQGGDVVEAGAYAASLSRAAKAGRGIKMLWQHDPREPIGVWDEVEEDGTGLRVKGRILDCVARGREASALIKAGAIDGLSIGYRTVSAAKGTQGHRLLQEVELWEVSVVTFPMLQQARLGGKGDGPGDGLRDLAEALEAARRMMAGQD